MNCNIILAGLFSVLLFAQVQGFQQCKGENMSIDDGFKAAMKTCATKYKVEQGQQPDPCFLPCIYSELGCLTDGKFDTDKFKAVASKKYPTSAQKEINEGAQKCVSENPGALSMDDNCQSWSKIKACLWKSQMTVCKGAGKDSDADE